MTRQALVLLADSSAWSATAANGQPSTELSLTVSAAGRLGQPAGRIEATGAAGQHRLQATVKATDLRGFEDLELWIRADRRADGSPRAPWFLELRLGSAGRPIGSAGNTWHRLVPVPTENRWELVRVTLADLATQIRQGVNAIRLTCLHGPFSCLVDGPWAVRATPIADVDQALSDLLHNRLKINGAAVPFVLEPSTATVPPPKLTGRQTTAAVRADLAVTGPYRTDYVGSRFSLRPPAVPTELGYELTVSGSDRDGQVALLEFLIGTLSGTATLQVAGRLLPITVTALDPERLADGLAGLTVTVLTSVPATGQPITAVPPFNRIEVEVDSRASA